MGSNPPLNCKTHELCISLNQYSEKWEGQGGEGQGERRGRARGKKKIGGDKKKVRKKHPLLVMIPPAS